jgi:hypothetical protein
MAIATIISIYPKEIRELKAGLIPNEYVVPEGSMDKPAVIHISDAKHLIPQAFGAPAIQSYESAEKVAKSVVFDWIKAQMRYSEDAHPGIMALSYEIPADQVKFKLLDELKKLESKQIRWAQALLKDGDDMWERYGENRAITDTQRWAANYLKQPREWTNIEAGGNLMDCPSCDARISKNVATCRTCGCIINKEKYDKLEFANK